MASVEKQVDSEVIFKGKIVEIRRDKAELENGKIVTREVVHASGGACVIAVDNDDYIYLVKQFRYPFGQVLLELPAGKLENGEAPDTTAIRELEEECGLKANSVKLLGKLYPTVAFCDEKIYIYLADDFIKTKQSLDEGEFVEVVKLPFDKAYCMVMNGEICDAKTQIAILKYKELKCQKI